MIAMNFKTFKIKVLVFTLSNLLSIRDLVDTQQLIFPYKNYAISKLLYTIFFTFKLTLCLYHHYLKETH